MNGVFLFVQHLPLSSILSSSGVKCIIYTCINTHPFRHTSTDYEGLLQVSSLCSTYSSATSSHFYRPSLNMNPGGRPNLGASRSVFMDAVEILDLYKCIPGWREVYLDPILDRESDLNPTDLIWKIFQQGGSLCLLCNLLQKGTIDQGDITPLEMTDATPFEGKNCKRNVYKFLEACQDTFFMPDEQIFQVSDIYKNDTIGLVKAINLVHELFRRIRANKRIGIDFTKPIKSAKELEAEATSKIDSITIEGDEDASKRSSAALSTKSSSSDLDKRENVIVEMLETERKYVNDLERLQDYMKEIERDKNRTLPLDVLHGLFTNLNELIDFQRRFLFDMETVRYKPTAKNNFGTLFVNSIGKDKNFSVYHVFCSNYPNAIQIATEHKEELSKYDEFLHEYELPSYLIKPVQRICKYPLLVRELIRYTPEDHPERAAIEEAHEVMKKVAGDVNEEHRKGENILIAEDMRKRIEDWKGLDFTGLGPLVYMEKLVVIIKDIEKEVFVYLYENGIVFCKESSSSLTIKKRKYAPLSIRTYIKMDAFHSVSNTSKNGVFTLKCFWKDIEMESFTLKFINDEMHSKWMTALNELIAKTKERISAALQRTVPVGDELELKRLAAMGVYPEVRAEEYGAVLPPGAVPEATMGPKRGFAGRQRESKSHRESVSSLAALMQSRRVPEEAPLGYIDENESGIVQMFDDATRDLAAYFYVNRPLTGQKMILPKLLKVHYDDNIWFTEFPKATNGTQDHISFETFKLYVLSKVRIDLTIGGGGEEATPEGQGSLSPSSMPAINQGLYYRDREKDLVHLQNQEDLDLALQDWSDRRAMSIVVRSDPGRTSSTVVRTKMVKVKKGGRMPASSASDSEKTSIRSVRSARIEQTASVDSAKAGSPRPSNLSSPVTPHASPSTPPATATS